MTKHSVIKILSTLLIFLTLISCESFYWATIINDSDKNLTIRIKYKLEKQNKTEKTNYNSEQKIEIIKLKPTEEYQLEAKSIREKPNFEEIEEIEILSNDTLILKTKSIFLDELFSTDEDKGIYELRIE